MTDRRWQMGVGAVAGLVWLLGTSVIESRVSAPPAAAPAAPKTVRLYVFDCGLFLERDNAPAVYHLTRAQVADTRMSVPCFLIAHPKGTLMWDVGVIPDARIGENIGGAVATRTLASQLTEIGYQPADITYLAMSHGHRDHSANANDFAGSTWLTPLSERDFMFAGNNPRVDPAYYDKLKTSKTIIINTDEHDVFGDGKVVLKAAPGHTPGHQVVVVKLAKSGTILLCGDLYHYPEERSLRAAPPNNEQGGIEQTVASRQKIEAYLVKTKAQMWIEHDFLANAKLKKSPGYYE
jgi:glyoxylase-like metal-dependent hydrolase (beta-lactamase superfamily II)